MNIVRPLQNEDALDIILRTNIMRDSFAMVRVVVKMNSAVKTILYPFFNVDCGISAYSHTYIKINSCNHSNYIHGIETYLMSIPMKIIVRE